MIDPRIERKTLFIAKIAPPVVLGVAILDLILWFIPSMHFFAHHLYKCNTAVGFVFACLATLCVQHADRISRRVQRLGSALAVAVFLIGLVTTAEYVFSLNLGLDQILTLDITSPENALFPGRMSPITSMLFVLLSAGLLLFGKTWDRERVASASALPFIPLLIISLFSIVGYMYGLTPFYKVGIFIRIAWPASLSFIFLSLSLLFTQTRLSPVRVLMSSGVGGMTARRLLPLVIALPISLAWFGLEIERLGFLREEFAVSLLGMVMVVSLISIFLLVARDMDRLYFRELELKERERRASERLGQVLDATELATFEWNVENEELIWNVFHEKLFGYEPGQAIRQAEDFDRRVHPDDLAKVWAAAEAAIKNETDFVADYRIILPSGEVRWLYCKGRHFHELDTGSNILRGTVIDLTARKLAEQQARESEARLDLALTSANIGFWDVDMSSGGNFVSQTLMADWGVDPATFKGTWAECVNRIHPEDVDRVVRGTEAAIANRQQQYNEEFRVVRPNGEVIWILNKGSYFEDKRTKAGRLTGITINITERKRAQRELEQAKEQAESASRLKSAFLANMSHEIRTPLGVMLGFTDLLTDPEVNEKDKAHFADTLKRNGEQLTLLINDILDLSKVEAGQLKVESIAFSLRGLISETIAALKVKADEKGLRLSFEIENTFSDRMVSDPIRIKQILWNLIGNAIKFTPQGEILLKVVHRRENLEIEIKDSGIGISSEQQAVLFKPFSQADESITRKFGGTGLGLALSRRLAELLGGDLTLEQSRLGHGSTFRLIIRDYGFALNEVSELPTPSYSSKSLELDECLRGLKILLVEDSPDNQDLIGRILERRGAQVELAENGKVGAELALRGNFDVVLMDVQMPVLDGLSATTLLRAVGFRRPIIALTAHAMSEVRKQCLDAGCSDYLSKPVNARELLRKVLQLSHKELHSETAG